jgi:hypothetical protein
VGAHHELLPFRRMERHPILWAKDLLPVPLFMAA